MWRRAKLCAVLLRLQLADAIASHESSAPSTSGGVGGILGLGSNVVDRFYRVRGPEGVAGAAGQKGYFASEGEVVGGVTLNHLSWASSLGVPVALAARQGSDEAGRAIRASMAEHAVSGRALAVHDDAASSVSHVILDETGERTILMAPHATSTLGGAMVRELFGEAVRASKLVTTEVSQVPLEGVFAFLDAAAAAGVPSVLDVDVPPSVAATAAALCESPAEVLECARRATVVKATQPSAEELVSLAGDGAAASASGAATSDPLATARDLAVALQRATGAPLVAITAGSAGGALAAPHGVCVALGAPAIDHITDTTGAGDAFLGGLLAALWQGGVATTGALPTVEAELHRCLAAANAAGAACCETLGGLPPLGAARSRVLELMRSSLPAPEASGVLPPDETVAEAATSPAASAEGRGSATAADGADAIESAVAVSVASDAATAASVAADADLVASVLAAASEIDRVRNKGGHCLVTGLGKSGAVATRLAASLASTGCRAHFVHAAEWSHGDLGNMPDASSEPAAAPAATLIAISHSGKTAEVAGACREAAARGMGVVLIAGGGQDAARASAAGSVASHVLSYQLPAFVTEPYGGAPTASIVAQEAVANALVVALATATGFDAPRFRRNHPGGSLGQSLASLAEK